MRLCLLVLAAFAASVCADSGQLVMTCRDGWTLFHTNYEASCLKLMSEPMLFDDSYKACQADKARLLSFAHRMDKVYFINDLIVKSNQHDTDSTSLWFFDPTFMHRSLPRARGHGKHQRTEKEEKPDEAPKPQFWMVINPNKDHSKIELEANKTNIPRNFICEAPAHPAAQRPQFQIEPEHLFITEALIKPATEETTKKADKEARPFIVTFNCLAYGMPKPTVEWRLVKKVANESLITELIDAKITTNPHEPLKDHSTTSTSFFNLQRDCKAHHPCPPDSIEERSQLVIVNPQFMDLTKAVVCLAKNEFGSVISREAQFFVTKMGEFAKKEDEVTVKAGMSAIVSNAITTEPDAAAAECYIVEKPRAGPPRPRLIPLEQLNQMLHGAIQMSKATFDLIIDSAGPKVNEEFLCRARLHNGRMGHVTREKTIALTVEPCIKEQGCDLEAKPVSVVEGYPAVLSMNPLSNRIIRFGDDFLLECPCTGKRRPDEELTVEWNLNNKTDMPVVEVPVLPRFSAMLVRDAKPEEHSGTYFCQCIRGQEKSDWRSIDVQVLPLLEPADHREIITVKAGQKASFGCRVNAELAGLGVFVEPMRDAETLADFLARTDDKRIEIMRGSANHYTVGIDDVKESDAGVYGCRVTVNFFEKWITHDTFYSTLIVEK